MKRKAAKKRVKVYEQQGLALLAQKIKELRGLKDITQEELAHRSGLALSQIARIETVKANPTVSTLFRIARALNLEPRKLFEFKVVVEK